MSSSINRLTAPVSRSILAILLGIILVIWPGLALNYVVIVIGLLLLLMGVISVVSFYRAKSAGYIMNGSFPLDGFLMAALGIAMIAIPPFFVSILMYIIAFLLILGGVGQLSVLASARKAGPVSGVYYIFPVLILLAGILIIMNPFGTAANLFMFCGITAIIYGVIDVINHLRFNRALRK